MPDLGLGYGNRTFSVLAWKRDPLTEGYLIAVKVPSAKHWGDRLHPSVSKPGHIDIWRTLSISGYGDGNAKMGFTGIIDFRAVIVLTLPLSSAGYDSEAVRAAFDRALPSVVMGKRR